MRIVVNDIAASKGGAMTILKQFYDYIVEHDDSNEWIFLLGDYYLKETNRIRIITLPEVKNSRIKKVIFDCFTGKRFISSLKPDLVISLQNIITFGVKVPQYVYVHQSIPFQNIKNFSFFKKDERNLAIMQKIIGRLIIKSVRKADKVVVQTKWMKNAVVKKAKINEEKIVTYLPKVEFFKPKQQLFDNKRFFYPTINAVYKNIDTIIKACDLLNSEGISDFTIRLTLQENDIIHPNIECIGYLNRVEMEKEYQSGTLIFASYIETIGLPLLEAKSCNTRIIASNTPFSHECLDDYDRVEFFNYFDAIMLAKIIKKSIQN